MKKINGMRLTSLMQFKLAILLLSLYYYVIILGNCSKSTAINTKISQTVLYIQILL